MIRALLVDDEELARRGLQLRLDKYDDFTICGECQNGREAIAAVAELQPDVLFLDIQMPGLNGFDVLRSLANTQMPVVVFVTAYDDFAVQAFEANALEYLLKPINDQRFTQAIDRIRLAVLDKRSSSNTDKLLKLICNLSGQELTLKEALEQPSVQSKQYPQRLSVRDGNKTHIVTVHSIEWIAAARDYMCIHASGETHVLRGTMKSVEHTLDPEYFVRIHRSTIVNRRFVTSMRPHRNGECFVSVGERQEFKMSRKYKDSIERLKIASIEKK